MMEEQKNITKEIRKFVEGCFNLPGANYKGSYEGHFVPMHRYAVELAKKSGADLEIVEIAAWLHDIGSILYKREDHHITGAEIAERKLRELGYPEEKIKKVKKCILNHRGSVNNHRKSAEEQIIAEADVLSNFDNIGGIFEAAIVCENLHQKDASKAVLTKLKQKYNQLSEEGKKLVRPKYDAVMLLLGN